MSFSRESNEEQYKCDIYRRIQLAAAVHIVRSTPMGKSPLAHATDLQQKLKLVWMNSSLSTRAKKLQLRLDQHILTQQQDLLASRLHSTISQSTGHISDFIQSSSDISNTQDRRSEVQAYLDNLNFNREIIHANANFMQAIIQLRALAEAQTTIPMEKYVNSVSRLGNRRKRSNCPRNMNVLQGDPSSSSSTDDSGFHTPEDCCIIDPSRPESGIASSVILYIVNSCNANDLLRKSIGAILSQLREIACTNDNIWAAAGFNETMNHWMDSVYQQAVIALQSIISLSSIHSDMIMSSHSLCCSFIQEMIEHISIINFTDEAKYNTKENQILMILKLFEGTDLWIQTLDFLFRKIVTFAHLIKDKERELQKMQRISGFKLENMFINHMLNYTLEIEQGFFLFRGARIFLTNVRKHLALIPERKWHRNSEEPQEQQIENSTISQLWKKHYNVQIDRHVTPPGVENIFCEAMSHVRNWNQIVDDSFKHIMYAHSLIAVTVWECVQLLNSLTLSMNGKFKEK